MNELTLLLKPTHACNLDCTYCYDKKNRNKIGDIKISEESIENIKKKLIPCYSSIQLIWHGGEALVAGIDWIVLKTKEFKKVADDNNVKISFGLQSNGILLTKDNIEKLNEVGIRPSASFDIDDNKERGFSKIIKKNIFENNINFISVINYESSFKLIEKYEEFKKMILKPSFNIIFDYDFDKDNKKLKEYVENWKKYITHIFYDKNDPYEERESFDYLKSILSKTNVVCHHKNCIKKYLCIDPLGDIQHCDRGFPEKYKFGNINKLNTSILEIYNSEKYINFEKENKEFLNNCREKCEVYSLCHGGCPNERFKNSNDKMINDNYQCYIRKELYKHCFDLMKNIKEEDMMNINPLIFKEIWEQDYFSLERIRNEF